jgi:hypothetical protein
LATAAGLVLGSTAAAAAPAATRDASPAAKSDDLAGIGTFGILLGLLIVAGVVAIIATDNNNHPTCPLSGSSGQNDNRRDFPAVFCCLLAIIPRRKPPGLR